MIIAKRINSSLHVFVWIISVIEILTNGKEIFVHNPANYIDLFVNSGMYLCDKRTSTKYSKVEFKRFEDEILNNNLGLERIFLQDTEYRKILRKDLIGFQTDPRSKDKFLALRNNLFKRNAATKDLFICLGSELIESFYYSKISARESICGIKSEVSKETLIFPEFNKTYWSIIYSRCTSPYSTQTINLNFEIQEYQLVIGFKSDEISKRSCEFDRNLCNLKSKKTENLIRNKRQAIENAMSQETVIETPCVQTSQKSKELLLRTIPLAVQSFTITICLFLATLIFRLRRTRVIKAANWVLLEIFIFGAVCLFCTNVVMYFPASDITCFLRPWMKEFGFAVMYGVLFVKIYKVLSSFQSRKAHRVHVKDKDLLKYLGVFSLLSVAFMTTWTCTNLDYISISPWSPHRNLSLKMTDSGPLIETDFIEDYFPQSFITPVNCSSNISVCRALSWDVVAEIIEFIIVAVCIRYCKMVRSAPSEYNEIYFITIALINELLLSTLLHILRHFIWYTLNPAYIFVIYFAHSHLTVTVTIILLLVPKFWYLYRRPTTALGTSNRSRPSGLVSPGNEHLIPANKLNLLSNGGDIEFTDINLADMDPEIIRRELRRIYTQIEIYKTKAMRKDNPHVSKRRGGRKQRRFSLQPFHKKHHVHGSSGGQQTLIQSDSGSGLMSPASGGISAVIMPDSQSARYPSMEDSIGTLGGMIISKSNQRNHQHSGTFSGANLLGSTSSKSGGRGAAIILDEEYSRMSEESSNSAIDEPSSINPPHANQKR